MNTVKNYIYVAAGVVLFMLLGYLYYLNDRLESTKTKLELANQNISSLNHYIDKTNQQLKDIQQLDKDYQEKLTYAQTENDKLRDDLINNVKRVYVKAKCPSLPNNTTTTSKPNAIIAQLTGNVRQDYLRLRLEIAQTKEQILQLQSYITSVCLKP
ncbi:lysis protein [Entomomonas moraniae]|uniref:Lysis protein n=1 Tax=Entomomonas moraniae TaxID=2213226 RepID=A0A3Q9JH22_9GAMM|nr:lysis system i-spanin subunit Rz [Entomomonas moraniae]AZS49359.1 lysis protein [Entomomonas moraniae]